MLSIDPVIVSLIERLARLEMSLTITNQAVQSHDQLLGELRQAEQRRQATDAVKQAR